MTNQPMPACITKFLCPTDHRGSRVKATHCNTKRSVTLSWDHEFGAFGNHRRAAEELLQNARLNYCGHEGGYIFMVREQ